MKQRYVALISLAITLVLSYGLYVSMSSFAHQKTVEAQEQTKVQEPDRRVFTPLTVENLLIAINAERAKAGVQPLILDVRLNQSAQTKADDMRARDYRAHLDSEGVPGTSYIEPSMCRVRSENLGWNSNGDMYERLEIAVEWWKGSSSHYAAMIEGNYIYTGFGINGDIVVEHFCQP